MVPDNDIDHHWVIPPLSLHSNCIMPMFGSLISFFSLQFGTKASFFVKGDLERMHFVGFFISEKDCTCFRWSSVKRVDSIISGVRAALGNSSQKTCTLLSSWREWQLYQTLTGSLNEIIVLRFLFQVIFLVLPFSLFVQECGILNISTYFWRALIISEGISSLFYKFR